METLIITGAGPRGVTGKLIKEYFEGRYNLLTPGSADLDLTNDEEVANFFDSHHVDYVIHCATFRTTSVHDGHFVDEELESNLRMYFSLAAQSTKYKKMIYFGSGAEYDKSKPIVNATEDNFGQSIPKTKYGLGKYIMNMNAINSKNIYNLRLFGTINKYERFTKNIVSNLCVKAIMGLPLNLRQDCVFSFVDINDVLPVLDYALTNELRYHDYNLTSGKSYLLSDIAKIILSLSGRNDEIHYEKEGLNKEYTGINERMANEFHPFHSSIEEAVKIVYDYYYSIRKTIDVTEIDARWK